MKRVHLQAHIVAQKVLADVSPQFAECYHLPEGHRNVAFFSADNDDVSFVAADDATKKANIKIQIASATYGGMKGSWSKNAGCVFVLMSGPRIEDVRNGLRYANDFIENHCAMGCFDGILQYNYYAQCVPRVGSYYRDLCNIPEGSAYSYLLGPPIEANYALDQAMKSGEVKLARYFYPPAKVNSGGGIIYGTESACRAATESFLNALHDAFMNPLKY